MPSRSKAGWAPAAANELQLDSPNAQVRLETRPLPVGPIFLDLTVRLRLVDRPHPRAVRRHAGADRNSHDPTGSPRGPPPAVDVSDSHCLAEHAPLAVAELVSNLLGETLDTHEFEVHYTASESLPRFVLTNC